jgi:hypothetical protein
LRCIAGGDARRRPDKAAGGLDQQPAPPFHWTERLELATHRREAEALPKEPAPRPEN